MLRSSRAIKVTGVFSGGGARRLGVCGTEGKVLPSTADVVLCFKFANADHIVDSWVVTRMQVGL